MTGGSTGVRRIGSVVPERDFAPKIDKQRGLVQYEPTTLLLSEWR